MKRPCEFCKKDGTHVWACNAAMPGVICNATLRCDNHHPEDSDYHRLAEYDPMKHDEMLEFTTKESPCLTGSNRSNTCWDCHRVVFSKTDWNLGLYLRPHNVSIPLPGDLKIVYVCLPCTRLRYKEDRYSLEQLEADVRNAFPKEKESKK